VGLRRVSGREKEKNKNKLEFLNKEIDDIRNLGRSEKEKLREENVSH
jgi:hypothetical protein